MPLWCGRSRVFFPSHMPLAGSTSAVEMNELVDYAFVGVEPVVNCGMHEHLMTLCGTAGFTPRIEQEARELNTVLGLVSAGLGIAVLPECYTCVGMPGVSSRPIAGAAAESWLMIATRERALPPPLERFVDVACNVDAADAPRLVPRMRPADA